MNTLNRNILLACMRRHETFTIDNLARAENLGFVPKARQLSVLLGVLIHSGELVLLPGVAPATYTITNKGIGSAAS